MQNPKRRLMLLLSLLLLFTLVFTACSQEPVEVTRVLEGEVPGPEVEVTREVEVEVPGPFLELWQSSGHADASAEAFVHWDEDDPAEVPTRCAKCHSTPGYLDFLGADGTEFGVVDNPSPLGTTVECAACHNDVKVFCFTHVFSPVSS